MLVSVAGVGVSVSAAYSRTYRTGAPEPALSTAARTSSIGGTPTASAAATPVATTASSASGRARRAAGRPDLAGGVALLVTATRCLAARPHVDGSPTPYRFC